MEEAPVLRQPWVWIPLSFSRWSMHLCRGLQRLRNGLVRYPHPSGVAWVNVCRRCAVSRREQ